MQVLDWGRPDRSVDLVFLHATGFNALTYRHILGPLAARYRILAVDQRGHGGANLTADPEDRPDWCDYRDDLLAVREALDLNSVVLAGHSMGATVSLLAAGRSSGFARRLVLFDPVILPVPFVPRGGPYDLAAGAERRRTVYDSRAQAFGSYRGRGAFVGWPDGMVRDYVEAGFRDLPSGEVTLTCAPLWEASTYRAQRHDSRAAFETSGCPIDLFKAEHNSATHFDPLADTPDAAARIDLRVVSGAGHFLPMQFPDLARDALVAAIEGKRLSTDFADFTSGSRED